MHRLPRIEPIRANLKYLRNVIIADGDVSARAALCGSYDKASPALDLLTRAGTTALSGCTVPAQPDSPKDDSPPHDMIIEAEYYAKRTIGLQDPT
jgi:hypothetical protein